MKKKIAAILFFFCLASSCQKDERDQEISQSITSSTQSLTVSDVQSYLKTLSESGNTIQAQSGTQTFILRKHKFDLANLKPVNYSGGNILTVPLPGQPIIDNLKQGYRKLLFFKGKDGQVQPRVIEVIPDLLYGWKKNITRNDFTGRVFIYDLNYKLLKGVILKNGEIRGEIKPETAKSKSSLPSVSLVQVSEDCAWVNDGYINSEGEITLYTYKVCSYEIYDDGYNEIVDDGGGWVPPGDGGDIYGGSGGSSSSAPPPSAPELVIEAQGEQLSLESKLSCLGMNTLSPTGTFKVTVFADAPVNNDLSANFNFSTGNPGHTFVQLSSTIDGTTSSLSFGFYPFTGTKSTFMDNVSSKIANDQNHEYEASITYELTAQQMGALISGYKVHSGDGYDIVKNNCVDYAVGPLKSLGFEIPSAERSVSVYGKMNTPAGLVQGLQNLKNSDPGKYSNINAGSSQTSPSNKGGCGN